MKSPLLKLALVSLVLIGLSACVGIKKQMPEVVVLIPEGSAYAEDEEMIDFVKDIQPILEANCVRCHNDGSMMTSVSFQTRKQIIAATSDKRPILIPGDPESSTMFLVTTLPEYFVEAMPAEGHKLNEVERWLLYRWILEGAVWPKEVKLQTPVENRMADVSNSPQLAALAD